MQSPRCSVWSAHVCRGVLLHLWFATCPPAAPRGNDRSIIKDRPSSVRFLGEIPCHSVKHDWCGSRDECW
uniref:Putative secreted protein n=1 Tax=Anopheles darlingi TaxID=43151 RepID=A0A2M4DQ74_ANODA